MQDIDREGEREQKVSIKEAGEKEMEEGKGRATQ